MRPRSRLPGLGVLGLLGCSAGPAPAPPPTPDYVEPREPCAAKNPLRNLYFGDLHVHTRLSFDAYAMDVRISPEQAYRFARGEEVRLPPLGMDGEGQQRLRIDRPLDFAALTDHSEFLGEVEACSVPGSAGYASSTCEAYRMGGNGAVSQLGIRLTLPRPMRPADVCPPDPASPDRASSCAPLLGAVWRGVQRAAAEAYDKTAACRFTSFVAYEYSAGPALSTLHRNVIFANDRVPAPTTYFEQPSPEGLWRELHAGCKDAGTGCDVLAIPHNANESNGKMFFIESAEEGGPQDPAAHARLRAELEPLFEVYQHKGDSECMNGLSGVLGAPDELCGFEKTLRPPAEIPDCGDGTGSGGTTRKGCISRRDFVRNALLDGLALEERLGINPFRVGLIASTDTHNGTPGAVAEDRFIGHRGTDDDTPDKQLGRGNLTPGGVEFSPGGLTAVWAEENSRPALFAALKRREVYGTSGPRLAVRFFGGFDLPDNLCDDPQLVARAYAGGVPMGGILLPRPGTAAPRFVVQALRDPMGGKLQVAQVLKGVLRDGRAETFVYDVAGQRKNGARVDESTCTPSGPGADSLCAVFTDPDFRPGERAFYYVRVVENPSCRWTAHVCNRLPAANRPPTCSDPTVPRTQQERAWTSPIWYQPQPAAR
ncbi:MAG: DUF3604 domain-containing protein [Polyangia bacterium]